MMLRHFTQHLLSHYFSIMAYTKEEITKIILDGGWTVEEFLAEIPKGGKYQISVLKECFDNWFGGSVLIKEIVHQEDLTHIKTVEDFVEVMNKVDAVKEMIKDIPSVRITHSKQNMQEAEDQDVFTF